MVVGEIGSFQSFPKQFQSSMHPASSDKKESSVKSFVQGIVSPFTACWQPSINGCVPGCDARDYRFGKSPAVVSPYAERGGQHHQRPHRHQHFQHQHQHQPRHAATSPGAAAAPEYEVSVVSPANKAREEPQPTKDIEKPHSNDVLCGRGGSSNRHLGNMHFRELVAANKKTYVGLTKKQKMLVARKIVEMVHTTDPPGRFLAKDLDTGLWYDIGLPRSLEKTSQALREKNSNDFPTHQTEEHGHFSTDTAQLGWSDPRKAVTVSIEDGSAKTSRSSKNVEAPPLIIPYHLMEIFGPKKARKSQLAWSEHPQPPQQIDQPHLHTYTPRAPASPREHYHVPPRTPPSAYGGTPPRPMEPYYDRSAPRNPQDTRYYERSPPYSHAEDYRDHYDYYPRRSERDPYSRHPTTGGAYSRRLPPPPPGHYHGYQAAPPPPRPSPPHPSPAPSPRHSRLIHNVSPTSHAASYRTPITPPVNTRSPQPSQSQHAGYAHPATPPTPAQMPPAPSSPPTNYRCSSPVNGHVRSKGEISPERRQEWKRQRDEKGVARRLSESSLTTAVANSLSLEERVVGRERNGVNGVRELTSPSGLLQSRARRSTDPKPKSNSQGMETDYSGLSGLAALSTAAFLKLDEA